MFAFGTGKTLGIVNFYSNYWLIITLVNRGFNANRILMTLHCKAQLQLVTKHVNCDSVSYSKSLNRKKFDIVLKHIHLKMTVVTPYFWAIEHFEIFSCPRENQPAQQFFVKFVLSHFLMLEVFYSHYFLKTKQILTICTKLHKTSQYP